MDKKKGVGGNFDVSIEAYDGAEICELVGCVLLYSINKIANFIKHNRHFMPTYREFERIRSNSRITFIVFGGELIYVLSIVVCIPSTFCKGEAKESKGDLTVLWLDLANAMPHELVEEALTRHHVPPSVCDLIADYYKNFRLRACSS